MRINTSIKNFYREISAQSIAYANTPDNERKYHKRLLKLFKEQLTEEEQLYIFKTVTESLHYKNIVTDPDNVLQLHNIRLRTLIVEGVIISFLIIIAGGVFHTNESIDRIIAALGNMFKLLSLQGNL